MGTSIHIDRKLASRKFSTIARAASGMWCLLPVLFFLIHALRLYSSNDVTDDAFISFRYAQHLARGYGLVWNMGDLPVEGYTNFLYVVLLSVFARLGYDLWTVSQMIGVLSAVGTLVLVARISSQFGVGSLGRLLPPFLLAASASFAQWARGGLETHLFTLLIVLGAYWHIQGLVSNNGGRWKVFSTVAFILAALTRPEGILVYVVTIAHQIIVHFHKKTHLLSRIEALSIVGFFLCWGGYFAWRFSYFGFLFPNTYYAKTGGGIWQVIGGAHYVLQFLASTGGIPFYTFALVGFLRRSENEVKTYCLLLGVIYTAYIVMVGGDHHTGFRFFVPMLPFLYILIGFGSSHLADWILTGVNMRSRLRSFPSLLLVGSVVVAVLQPSLSMARLSPAYLLRQTWFIDTLNNSDIANRIRVGRYLRHIALSGDTIAVGAAGAVPYHSGLRTIDYLGLNDLYIAHQDVKGTYAKIWMSGHEKGDGAYVLDQRPTFIILGPPSTDRYWSPPLGDYEAVDDIWANPDFKRLYHHCAIRLDNSWHSHIYVHSDRFFSGSLDCED